MSGDQQFFLAMATLLVTSLSSLILAVISARRTASNSTKLDRIHELTNGNLEHMRDALDLALRRIGELERDIRRQTSLETPDQ